MIINLVNIIIFNYEFSKGSNEKIKIIFLSLLFLPFFIQVSWGTPFELNYSSWRLKSTGQLKILDVNDLIKLNFPDMAKVACLDFSNSEMKDEAVIVLADWLENSIKFNYLTQLILRKCKIGNDGINALIKAFEKNQKLLKSLRIVDFSQNQIEASGIVSLLIAFPFGKNSPISQSIFDNNDNISSLRETNQGALILSDNQINEQDKKALKSAAIQTAKGVDARRVGKILIEKMDESTLNVLGLNAECMKILEIIFKWADCDNFCFSSEKDSLRNHGADLIKILALKEAEKIWEKSLIILDLSNSFGELTIGNEEIKILEKILVKFSIKVLNLSKNKIESAVLENFLGALNGNTSLEMLVLKDNQIKDVGVNALALVLKENFLKKLYLSKNQIGWVGGATLFLALRESTYLVVLDLSENQIGEQGASILALILKENISLKELYLRSNQIGDKGTRTLAEVLEIASALRWGFGLEILDLSDNQIGEEGGTALAKALNRNPSLKKLYLKDNHIGDVGAKAFAEVLTVKFGGASVWEGNIWLIILDLSNNQIGEEGGTALAKALNKYHSLKELYLKGNWIRNQGAIDFALALKENPSLETLDLSDNQIGEKGGSFLAKALEKNFSLKSLYLINNQIGNQGAVDFALSLEKNVFLKELYLSDNQIGNVGGTALAKALEENFYLELLDLSGHQIADKIVANFENFSNLLEFKK